MSSTIITSSQTKEIYEECKRNAAHGSYMYYSDLAKELGLDLSDVDDRVHKLGKILDDINREEMKHNRPMLTALVVHKSESAFGSERLRMPGSGFFTLAKELKKQKSNESDEDFFKRELNNVYNYWKPKVGGHT